MCILHNFLTFECIVYTLSNGQLFKSKQTGVTFFLSLLLFWKVQLCCTAGQSVLTSCLLLLPQVKALPPFRKRKYPFNPQTDHSRCCGKHFPGRDIWTLDKLYVKSIQPYPDAFSIALFIWRKLLLPLLPQSPLIPEYWRWKGLKTNDILFVGLTEGNLAFISMGGGTICILY